MQNEPKYLAGKTVTNGLTNLQNTTKITFEITRFVRYTLMIWPILYGPYNMGHIIKVYPLYMAHI